MLDPDTLAAHAERIDCDGYTILEGVIEPELRDALADDLVRLERFYGVTPSDNGFEGTKTVRIYNLLALGKLYERIPVHTDVLPVVEGVLDDGCLVSSLSSIAIDSGESAQPIHADDQLIPLTKPHVPTVCNTMWALTDFTEANGATRIIPGSHLRDHSPDFGAPYDSIAAEMPAGSVLVWHGSLWHGGGANTTVADSFFAEPRGPATSAKAGGEPPDASNKPQAPAAKEPPKGKPPANPPKPPKGRK